MVRDREERLVDAFVRAAGAVVDDYDVVQSLQGLLDDVVDLFSVDAANIMLANQDDVLEVAVATSGGAISCGRAQLSLDEGPCIDASRSGAVAAGEDPEAIRRRWHRFAPVAAEAGFASVFSVPMRSRGQVIGSLNVFRGSAGALPTSDVAALQGLADVATITILQQRSADHAARTQAQLQQALDSRIAIEQAKGFIAHTHGVDLDTAFALLRGHARANGMLLRETAQAVTDRSVTIPAADSSVPR